MISSPGFLHGTKKQDLPQAMLIPWLCYGTSLTSPALGLQLHHDLLRHGCVLSQLRHGHARQHSPGKC